MRLSHLLYQVPSCSLSGCSVSPPPLWDNLCQIYFLFNYDPCVTSELEGRAGYLFKVMVVRSSWVRGGGRPADCCLPLPAQLEAPQCAETLWSHWHCCWLCCPSGARAERKSLHLVHSPLRPWFTVAMVTSKDAPLDGSQQ